MVCDAVVSDTYVPPSWWNLTFPSSGSEGRNSHTLNRWAAGSSKLFGSIYKTSWSHIPWLCSQPTEDPITYHMPRFNIHEQQGHQTVLKISQKMCNNFLTLQNIWWCAPFEPVQHSEFISVVFSGVILTAVFGYKYCWHLLRKWNYSLSKLNECGVLPYIRYWRSSAV